MPYIYYIGYTAKINGEKVNITESDNGFCQIEINTLSRTLDNEENNFEKVEISYTGTLPMKITLGISLISFIYLLLAEFRDKNSKVRK